MTFFFRVYREHNGAKRGGQATVYKDTVLLHVANGTSIRSYCLGTPFIFLETEADRR